jgi:HK97 gp10 family phage protein
MSGSKVYIEGVAYTRSKLAKISREANKPIKASFERIAQTLVNDIKARVPSNTGTLRDSIEYRVNPDGLSAAIGPSVKNSKVRNATEGGNLNKDKIEWDKIRRSTKVKAFQPIKAYWVEFGTKGHKVKVKLRRTLAGEGVFYGKEVSVPAQPPRPFINPAYEAHKAEIVPLIRKEFDKLVKEAGLGSRRS